MYVCMYVCMYVYVCMCVYIYIYIHTYILCCNVLYSPSLHKVLKRVNTLNTPNLGGRQVGKPCNWLIIWNSSLVIVTRTEGNLRKTDRVLELHCFHPAVYL